MRALERVMKMAFGPSEAEEWTEEQHREWTDENITWKDFEEAVAKAKANKGMGVDGFNAYLLNTKLCPERVRRHYCACLHAMIREREFPERFREWRCVLAMKKGEDPRVVHRRRDLWLVPHAQKIVARMIGKEYVATANRKVPGSQGGFTEGRDAPAMHIPLGIQREICQEETRGVYRAFIDMGQFFPTIVREVQYRVEAWTGVTPTATAVMRALQDEAKGHAATAHGNTET